ncbi:MAG TPA: kelch repeat-containing protein, partial [Acidimicrobiales bacterium]|nr:kelch repeat-containing protein [Acidimicrobiales bacterium]
MRRHRVAVPLAALVCAVAASLPGVVPPLRAAAAPAPGQWRLTAPMATDHAVGTVLMPPMCVDHTAPPAYPCGRVLVTGGSHFEGKPQNTVELYDEASEQWASAAPMNQARQSHTTTLLADGRVLVTGGFAQEVLATVEIFDPLLGRWVRAAPTAVARQGHSATLMPSGKLLVAGGDRGAVSGVVATSEVFDPAGGANASGSWSDVRPMSANRSAHTATVVTGGSVLVAGGATAGEATPTAELYDAATGAWRSVPPMAVRRYAHA